MDRSKETDRGTNAILIELIEGESGSGKDAKVIDQV